MPEYRLYFMSRSNGHIDRLARFEAADDELAQEVLSSGKAKVLWSCGARKEKC
jgi:hypothetical protein